MTQQVECPESLHDLERVMVREDDHVREKPNTCCLGRDKSERREWIPVAPAPDS